MILGKVQDGESASQSGQPSPGAGESDPQTTQEQAMDSLLESLYGDGEEGGLGDAAPDVVRWLGDVRTYFPPAVADLLQEDALAKVNLRKLLKDPDFLATVEPDVALVGKLLSLSHVMPSESRESARALVQQVVDELREKLEYPLYQAVQGSLNRALRANRPRYREINWQRTIYANLKHYQPAQGTIVPERLVGYGRQRSSLRDVILCLDQSSSMAASAVYAGVFGAIMATLPALNTRLVAFSTAVVDLTDQLQDPVDMLFGVQLRGGTNIERAVAYCAQQVTRPRETILVLITDLFEGGDKETLVRRISSLVNDDVQVIVLLTLDDKGAPRFNRTLAAQIAELGVAAFSCTPDLFPDLMGAAINGHDIRQWAAGNGVVTAPRN
ncbi:MAG: VWA domain-containing protein [Caldilineaceae bacterium]|nr:VWA domain-containing protein [Caldilineaceae bacterium]